MIPGIIQLVEGNTFETSHCDGCDNCDNSCDNWCEASTCEGGQCQAEG